MKKVTLLTWLTLWCCHFNYLAAQEVIYLENTSFEGEVGIKQIPEGWENACQTEDFLPDIQNPAFRHPQLNNAEIPVPEALEGKSYLALYTDFKEKNGAIAQKLTQPLEAGYCYIYSVYAAYSLCRKPTLHQKRAIFYRPVRLRIWGSNHPKERGELLAESRAINFALWSKKTFLIEPLESWTYFIIEAIPDQDIDVEAYDGKILLDNGSPIGKVDCETIDYDFLDNVTYSFDPFTEYESYINRLLNRNWERSLFKEGTIELTMGAENILREIAEVTNQTRYEYKLYFALKEKNEELKKQRVQLLRDKMKEWGLKARYYYVSGFVHSDLGKAWNGKNQQIWVRYEYY